MRLAKKIFPFKEQCCLQQLWYSIFYVVYWLNTLEIKRIGQNQPCMNRIQLLSHTSTENILV